MATAAPRRRGRGGSQSRPNPRGSSTSRVSRAEYEAWRDGLPKSLAESRTAELLDGVCDLDVDALDVELPRGFGRD